MKTMFTDYRKHMQTAVVACCLALAALLLTTLGAQAQGVSYNPYLVQGIISPAPLLPVEFGGTGVAAFDVGNTGSTDMLLVPNQEMKLVITLSKGVPNVPNPSDPVAALAALGGDAVEWFNWTYEPAITTYRATQKVTIPGSTPTVLCGGAGWLRCCTIVGLVPRPDRRVPQTANPAVRSESLCSLCYTGIGSVMRVRPAVFAVCDLPFVSGAHMSTEILMPQLGESVVEGTVNRWPIAEGQPVRQDQPLLQITTDKVDTELPAPASGILLKILVPEGQTVAKGTVLAVIGDQGSGIRGQGSGVRGQGSGSGSRSQNRWTHRRWGLSHRWLGGLLANSASILARSAAPAAAAGLPRRMYWPTRPHPRHMSRLPAPMRTFRLPSSWSQITRPPQMTRLLRSLRCGRPSPGTWC